MPALLSVYFDFVRFAAAMVVLISHAWPEFVPQHPLPWPGHQAVVLFFVLSGYVIAFVSDTKECALSDFVVSRAARILSVTIPAIAISLVVAIITDLQWRTHLGEYALALGFLNESWWLNNVPATNAPYWSLCYEVWYYIIFAAYTYSRPGFYRLLATTTAALLAGPKILLLFPAWLLGVSLYRSRSTIVIGKAASFSIFGTTIAAYLLFFFADASIHLREMLRSAAPGFIASITASNQFVGDNLLAIIVAINFASVMSLARTAVWRYKSIGHLMNRVAGFTLSIYLYHYPVMLLAKHFHASGLIGIMTTVSVPVLLAFFTEVQRNRIKQLFRPRPPVPALVAAREH